MAAGGAQPGAQLVGLGARAGAGAHLIERAGAAGQQPRPDDHRVVAAENRAISAFHRRVDGERLVAGKSGAELHAPWAGGALADPPLQLGHERVGRAFDQRGQLVAGRRGRTFALARRGAESRPFLGPAAGHRLHVTARLARQRSPSGEPVAHPLRAGVIGGRRQTEIAELAAQLAEKLRRFRQRLDRIERVEQAPLRRGPRHELADALRPLAAAGGRADRVRLVAALPPDHAGEELDRQPVRRGGGFDQQADGFRGLARGIRRCRFLLRLCGRGVVRRILCDGARCKRQPHEDGRDEAANRHGTTTWLRGSRS